MISYWIGNGRSDFSVVGAKFAGTADNAITIGITSADPNGLAVGSGSLVVMVALSTGLQAL